MHYDDEEPATLADILDRAYQTALDNFGKLLVKTVAADVEFICRCANRAGTRFLMACLVAKLDNPALDIRKPYTEIGGEGIYSGRFYDEVYVAPFVFKHNLPVNPTTSFLTPAFRTNRTIIAPGAPLVGKPRALYEKVVALITAVHQGSVNPEYLLIDIIRWLIVIQEERSQRLATLTATLQAAQSEAGLPAESIVTLLRQHLALPKSARLPVLIVTAAYQAAQAYLDEWALPLQSHTAADSQTGALGDVQIALRDESNVVTVYEMKAKRVAREDLEIALRKVAALTPRIDNYIFITTEVIDEAVQELAATLHAKTGVEFVILDCLGFLCHFLHLFLSHPHELSRSIPKLGIG